MHLVVFIPRVGVDFWRFYIDKLWFAVGYTFSAYEINKLVYYNIINTGVLQWHQNFNMNQQSCLAVNFSFGLECFA